MVIDSIYDSGHIEGVYKSSTGVDGKTYPLYGIRNQDVDIPHEWNISFMVKWDGYGSITTWAGYCSSEISPPVIKTMWYLVRSGKEFSWERITANASTFRPLNGK